MNLKLTKLYLFLSLTSEHLVNLETLFILY